jgi:CubicO group peptidase (beta-lactamase class C family)
MPTTTHIDQTLRHAADTKEVAGVVAAAVTDKGNLYEGAFGKRDLGKADAMTLDSVFWIASMTKAITATAAMQLVERGKLQLDEPIGKLLPQLANPQVLEGFDADGNPKLRPAKRPITLRQLLTHTAGLTYDIWNADMGKYMAATGTPGIISCQDAALATPLVFDPGERWEYGINIDWVGKAVEAASGQKLDAYLRDNIFTPLGMKDTGFKLGASQRARLTGMHARTPDGLAAIPFELTQEPEFHMGGGGLYSTARDYLAFLQMLLHHGRYNGATVLKPETVEMMGKNHIGALKAGVLKTAAPDYSNDIDVFPGQDAKWGLSFLINPQKGPAGRSAGSLTWAGLANTYFWLDPVKRVAGVILTQVLPFADHKVLQLYGQFESGVYQALEAA